MEEVLIGVDLGGTRIRAARMDCQLQILQRVETLTLAHEGPEKTIERIKAEIRKVLPEDISTVSGIGLSVPGPLNPATGVIVRPPNLPGWVNVPIGDILKAEFNLPVYVGNDANVAALAEVARGAAHGYRHAIYITISTGIGGGVIIEGKMLLGKDGLGAEVGHMVMLVGDRVSTLENEAAGPDMAQQARERIEAGEKSVMVEMVNGDLDQLSGSVVGNAARQGDPLGLGIVRRSGFLVGLGIVNLLHIFNPEIIVVGGGVSNLDELVFDPMWEAIRRHCIDEAYWRDLVITKPLLGEDVSVIGAGALALTNGGMEDIAVVSAELDRRANR